MNAKLLLALACGCIGAAPVDGAAVTTADSVNHAYVMTVLGAEGEHADAFPIGATVIVGTTFNRSASDVIPEDEFGYYIDGVQALTVYAPASGYLARRGVGTLSLGNDLEEPEGVLDYLSATHVVPDVPGDIQYLTSILEVRQLVPSGSVPTMLGSDAVPSQPLRVASSVSFTAWSESSYTRVALQLAPEWTVEALALEFRNRILELVARGGLGKGIAASLIARFDQASVSKARTCGALAGLVRQIDHLPVRNADIAAADELKAMASTLAALSTHCRPAEPDTVGP